MKHLDYSLYESAEDLKLYFNSIFEKKEDDDQKPNEKDLEGKKQNADKIPVKYADLKNTNYKNIFDHWIVFTNDKTNENKTLKHIKEAAKAVDHKPKVHIFTAAQVDADEDESRIVIRDDDGEYEIKDESNINTLVFARLGVQGEDECEHAVQLLQDRGFLVLNPVKYSAVACNKYESACLFEKGEIPQPRFCLMTKEDLYDEKSFKEQIKRVYPDFDFEDPDKNEDKSVVVKILDGHGGTGVFMCDCKKLMAILQTIFAIAPTQQLLIQKKEEADGGDIRVHVLSLRDKQVILAAMKRVKLGGDFRSNVSLGAEAEPVKLTPEQEQIALKTAMLSKLPWCAVDIMPLVKGSNPELGDNVVLEINASPGSDGISQVIDKNFINILVNELDDPGEFMLQDKIAGFVEAVTIKFEDGVEKDFLAKLDTGNSTEASTLEVGEFTEKGGNITFSVDGKQLTFKKEGRILAKAGEEVYERPCIVIPEVTLGLRKVANVKVAIVKSRENKTTNMLLNRDILSKFGYVVSPYVSHILTAEMERVKII